MNILITGFTPQQNGRPNRPGYISVTDMMATTLRGMGHHVEHRAFDVHEDKAKNFDHVILALHPFNGLSARHKYQACECIYQAMEDGVPVHFTADDWNIALSIQGSRTIVKNPASAIKPFYDYCFEHDWAQKRSDRVVEACRVLSDVNEWPDCLLPLYPGGDYSILTRYLPLERIVPWNPASVTPAYKGKALANEDRDARWVFAVLSNQLEWLNSQELDWGVLHAGGKASRAPVFMKENEIYHEMLGSWGVLSCPYWHAGSGWYRIRHVMAMNAGCLIAGSPKELGFLGDAFDITPQQIESFGLEEAVDFRDRQQRVWREKVLSVDASEQLRAALSA